MAIVLHRAKTKLETFMCAEKRSQLDMDDFKMTRVAQCAVI